MFMLYLILLHLGQVGYGLIILLVAFVFIFSLDKIIKFIIYLLDKFEEGKQKKS
jgi:hypothetical protein